jgi:hypothetical protein
MFTAFAKLPVGQEARRAQGKSKVLKRENEIPKETVDIVRKFICQEYPWMLLLTKTIS